MRWIYTMQRYKLHHLLLWLALFAGWYYFRYQDYSTREKALVVTSIKVADLAIMVYVTNLLLIPRLMYKKKMGWFVLVFLSLIFAGSTLKLQVIGSFLSQARFNVFENFKTRFYDNVIPHFLLVCTGAAVKLLADYTRAQRRLMEVTKEKVEAELNFLKSQINPHFIFNSLNSIYFLIDKENAAARTALHKFSSLLRFQLYELNSDQVPIEKEIAYLQNYIELQRLRQADGSCIQFSCGPLVHGFSIQPLLLIPFVENAFKHLSHFDNGKSNTIDIKIDKMNGQLHFLVMNTTEPSLKNINHQEGGIGLANVKHRLALLYPQKHTLTITKKEDLFVVDLLLTI